MRKKMIGGGLVLISLIAFLWVWHHAFIQITVAGNQAEDFTYTLTNQANNRSTILHAHDNQIKKLVARGHYTISVTAGEKSFATTTQSGGFLQTSELSATLTPEKSRQFVGNNPAACMYYIHNLLISNTCQDLYSQFLEHLPASASVPTYTTKVPGNIDGAVEGIVQLGQDNVVILRATNGGGHFSFVATADFKLTSGVILTDLDKDKTYTVQPYGNGFIAYDSAIGKVFYYTSRNQRPSAIDIAAPKDNGLRPYALGSNGGAIAVAYSKQEGSVSAGGQDIENKQSKNRHSVVKVSGSDKEFGFKYNIESFAPCGSQKLCLTSQGKLHVYDISGSKARLLYSVGDVQAMIATGKRIFLVRRDDVLDYDIDKNEGVFAYTFSGYTYCGSQLGSSGLLLCVDNQKGARAALLLDQQKPNTDSIDKKVLKLSKPGSVKSVSTYKNYIYVSPQLGDPVYLGSSYGYTEASKAAASEQIASAVKSAGIDTNYYHIVNTLP